MISTSPATGSARRSLLAGRGPKTSPDETLLGLAAVEASQGDLERAARLAGAAHGRETADRSVDENRIWDRLYDEILTPARDRYGAESWDRAAGAAGLLSLEEAIDLALAHGPLALLQQSGQHTAAGRNYAVCRLPGTFSKAMANGAPLIRRTRLRHRLLMV
jgi:hypothetical protein